ncbi:MAG: hypothetical protein IJ389_02475 [Clostridia bacterium]|nr:hypothetical protein [Clostridia bacterium]
MALSKNLIAPGNYCAEKEVACDAFRCTFDIKNDTIICSDTEVNAVLIGDSITEFFDHNIYYNDYGVILNRGIGGDEAQFIAFRFEADVVQLNPKACIILVGVNNTWVLEDQKDENGCFKAEAVEEVVKTVVDAFESMFAQAKAAGIEMWICSCMPMGDGMPTIEERNKVLQRLNLEYQKLIEKHGGKYIDMWTPFVNDEGKMIPETSRDGVHPNGVGYRVMADTLKPYLEEAFGKR